MKRLLTLSTLAFFIAATAFAENTTHDQSAEKPHPPHWSYSGESGPEHWSELSHDFSACAEGRHQSPVNLKWTPLKGSRGIEFHYQSSELSVVDNGHTIQVNVPAGSYAIIDGHRYDLLQFHFHSKSEHTFSGKYFPLEVHFVHKDEAGKLAVIGVMYETGRANSNLEEVFSKFPSGSDPQVTAEINPLSLIPNVKTHYHYDGSLTTPPCSEGVNWNVLNTPMQLSDAQLDMFHKKYIGNFRPIQSPFERKPAVWE